MGAPDDDDPTLDDGAKPPAAGGDDELARTRAALKKANREAEESRRKLREVEDRDKSDGEKLRDSVAQLEKDLAAERARADRLDVALAKGLTASQAKRLVGDTREDLEADADEILEAFGSKPGSGAPPSRTPAPRLDPRGGTDPAEEPAETNPAKLAEAVPRM